MTKTISLSDDAYEDLVAVKRPDESFSELARRLAKLDRQRALFDPTLRIQLTDEEAEAWKQSIYRARDATLEPRHRWD